MKKYNANVYECTSLQNGTKMTIIHTRGSWRVSERKNKESCGSLILVQENDIDIDRPC